MIRPVAFFTVLSVACVFLIGCASGTQLSGVAYGTITEVSQQEKDNTSGKAAGAVIGGLIGLGTSSGRSNRTTLLRSGAGAAAGAVNPFQTVEREQVGLTLKLTPQINEGDAVRLKIEQEVESARQKVLAQRTCGGHVLVADVASA